MIFLAHHDSMVPACCLQVRNTVTVIVWMLMLILTQRTRQPMHHWYRLAIPKVRVTVRTAVTFGMADLWNGWPSEWQTGIAPL